MPKDNQAIPTYNPKSQPPHQKKANKCPVYLLACFVIFCAILLIFSSIVLHPTPPLINFTSALVKSLSYRTSNTSTPWFNITLSYGITIENVNSVGFKYENSTCNVMYGGVEVGEGIIGDGSVKAKGRNKEDVVVDARSNGLLDDDEKLRADINYGSLNMTSFAKLVGRFRVFNYFEFKKSSVMSCSMSLNLTGRSIQDLVCN